MQNWLHAISSLDSEGREMVLLLLAGFVLGLVFSAVFGLVPALIIRHLIAKAPLPKGKAALIYIPIIIISMISFKVINQSPSGTTIPWVIFYFIGLWILTRKGREVTKTGSVSDRGDKLKTQPPTASQRLRSYSPLYILLGILSVLAGFYYLLASSRRMAEPLSFTKMEQVEVPRSKSLRPSDSKFATINLPLGLQVAVPKNWRILDGNLNTTIETASEAALQLSGNDIQTVRKQNLFRANSPLENTYAGIAINVSDAELTPEQVRKASAGELAEMTSSLREVLPGILEQTGSSLIEMYSFEKKSIDGHPALFVSYLRNSSQGPVLVRMTRLFIKNRMVSLNLSYRISEGTIWKPIIYYIEDSFSVQ